MHNMDEFLFKVATGLNMEYKENIETIIEQARINRLVDPLLLWNREIFVNNENWETKKTKIEKRYKELKTVTQNFNKENIEYLNLKGLTMLKYYPKELIRQSNDFDFLVKDIHSYWKCHEIFTTLGYTFVYNPMLTKNKNNILGITKYMKEIDEDTVIYIEVNISNFIIAEATWFQESEIWKNTQILNYKGVELHIPNDNMNLIILIIEASGRDSFFVRDAVDFYFINKYGTLDYNYINRVLNDKFLIEVLNMFIKNNSTISTGSFTFINREILSIKRNLKHIIPNLIADKSFLKFYLWGLQLIGEKFVIKDRFLSLVRHMDKIMLPKQRFDNGIITHFYPLRMDIVGDFKWISYKKYQLVIMPIGTFLATNFGILEEEEEDDLKIFLARSFQNGKYRD